MRKRSIPTTLSPLWETLAPMLSKVDVTKFCNPSWLDIWTLWHLVILCGMPLDVVSDHPKHTKEFFVTNWEQFWAFYMYIQSIVSNYFLNTLGQNFKHLLGQEFANNLIFLVLSSANNDLVIYVFTTGVGCEITYVGSAELNNVPCISAKVTCTINFSDKETWVLRLKSCMISVLKGSKYLT